MAWTVLEKTSLKSGTTGLGDRTNVHKNYYCAVYMTVFSTAIYEDWDAIFHVYSIHVLPRAHRGWAWSYSVATTIGVPIGPHGRNTKEQHQYYPTREPVIFEATN